MGKQLWKNAGLIFLSVIFWTSPNGQAGTVRYAYDPAGRLTQVDYGGGVTLTITYDASGNLTNQVVASPVGLSVPFYQADVESYTGFAISNFSDRLARLNLSALGPDGQLRPWANNPANMTIDPGKQIAKLGSEIFGVNPNQTQSGWVKATTDNADVGSFFLVGSGARLDGSVAFTQQSKKFYFTRAFEGPTAFRGQRASTFLSIANPNDQAVVLRLTLFGPTAGQELAAPATENLPARGFLIKSFARRGQGDGGTEHPNGRGKLDIHGPLARPVRIDDLDFS